MADRFNLKLEKIFYTGEAMDMDTFWFIERKFKTMPYSGYGTTEVGSVLYQFGGFDDWVVKQGSLGKPMPGLDVKVVDPKGKEVPCGKVGEMVIKRSGKWIRTRDLAFVDNDGYFWYKGRADDVIISAGWTISPTEVEDTLQKHPAVREAAVIGIPDKDRGNIVKAFVVTNLESNLELENELKEFVKTTLSKHEYPREIEFVDSLPRTEGGKVSRKKLREIGQQVN
jgi:acetyl-CoA synthetase